jgi:hypothetical protein
MTINRTAARELASESLRLAGNAVLVGAVLVLALAVHTGAASLAWGAGGFVAGCLFAIVITSLTA